MGRLVHKEVDGMELLGFSLAGEESVVAAPQYNVCFDIGRAPREVIAIDNVCLSHGHMDHAAGIAYYLSQRNFVGIAPGRVIVHYSLQPALERLMAVWAEIEGHPSPGSILGVDHLTDVELRRGLLVRPFSVHHCPTALGYTLIEKRHKLRPELAGKSGPQLVELKKQGVQIEVPVEMPLLTYTGDTALGRFLELPFVRASRVVLIECTFFDREHLSRARAGKHIHVSDMPRVVEALPESRIVLTHVTRRTDMRAAARILERVLGAEALERVSFLMERPARAGRTRGGSEEMVDSPGGMTGPRKSIAPAHDGTTAGTGSQADEGSD